MADDATPLTIGGVPPPEEAGELTAPGDAAGPIGRGAAQTLQHLIAVLDREDRLEVGTGEWLDAFRSDGTAGEEAVREAILRALAMAADPTNFRILEALAASGSVATGELTKTIGVGELPLGHRIGDLVSAGLAAKQPETGGVAATAAGSAVVDLVHAAVAAGGKALQDGLP